MSNDQAAKIETMKPAARLGALFRRGACRRMLPHLEDGSVRRSWSTVPVGRVARQDAFPVESQPDRRSVRSAS